MSIIPGTISTPLEDRLAVLEATVQELQNRVNQLYGLGRNIGFDYSPNWSLQKFTITDHPATNSDPVNY